MSTPRKAPATKLVLWVIWTALFAGVFLYRHFLSRETPDRDSFEGTVDAFMIILILGPTAVSVFARAIMVPEAKHSGQLLVAMILGMATAEALTFFGLFLFTAYESLFIGISIGLMLLFLPVFLPNVPPLPRRD